MIEQPQNLVERLLPVEEAAMALRLSPRKLKLMLARHGYAIYEFGSRTQRVKEADLRELISKAAVTEPQQTEVA